MSENSILLLVHAKKKGNFFLKKDLSLILLYLTPYKWSINKTSWLYCHHVFIIRPPLTTSMVMTLVHATTVFTCQLYAVASYLVSLLPSLLSLPHTMQKTVNTIVKNCTPETWVTLMYRSQCHSGIRESHTLEGRNIKEEIVGKLLVLIYRLFEYLP